MPLRGDAFLTVVLVPMALVLVAGCSSTPVSGSGTTVPPVYSPSTSAMTAQQSADAAAVTGGCAASPTIALQKPSWSQPPAMAIDTTKTYLATVKTDAGSFVITLDAKHAPITVNNFVFLAQKNFYN
ncbi:MAG: peptidylprolyl isomerase, partial [Blastocatellia bacterium]